MLEVVLAMLYLPLNGECAQVHDRGPRENKQHQHRYRRRFAGEELLPAPPEVLSGTGEMPESSEHGGRPKGGGGARPARAGVAATARQVAPRSWRVAR